MRTALALPRGELRLALQAAAALVVARAYVALVRSPRAPARRAQSRGAAAAEHRALAAKVRRAMQRATRLVPGTTCLPQAVAAAWLLRRRGVPADVVVGAARDADGVRAHAWVRVGDFVVTGDDELERFTELTAAGRAG